MTMYKRTLLEKASVAVGGAAVCGLLSISAALGGTVVALCGATGNGETVPQNSGDSFTTDEIISGPIGINTDCSLKTSLVRSEAKSSVNSISDFGATSSIYGIEGGGNALASGRIVATISRQNSSVTEIPFTISDLTLESSIGNSAEVGFNFRILEDEFDLSSVLVEASGKFSLTGSNHFNVSATDQAGFTNAFAQNIDVLLEIPGTSSNDPATRDKYTYKAFLPDAYTNSLDISDLDIDREYYLDYSFYAQAKGNFARATFQDPLNANGTGGIDPDVFTALKSSFFTNPNPTPQPTPMPSPSPSAVPLPATAWFMVWALGAFGVGSRVQKRNRRQHQ